MTDAGETTTAPQVEDYTSERLFREQEVARDIAWRRINHDAWALLALDRPRWAQDLLIQQLYGSEWRSAAMFYPARELPEASVMVDTSCDPPRGLPEWTLPTFEVLRAYTRAVCDHALAGHLHAPVVALRFELSGPGGWVLLRTPTGPTPLEIDAEEESKKQAAFLVTDWIPRPAFFAVERWVEEQGWAWGALPGTRWDKPRILTPHVHDHRLALRMTMEQLHMIRSPRPLATGPWRPRPGEEMFESNLLLFGHLGNLPVGRLPDADERYLPDRRCRADALVRENIIEASFYHTAYIGEPDCPMKLGRKVQKISAQWTLDAQTGVPILPFVHPPELIPPTFTRQREIRSQRIPFIQPLPGDPSDA